MCGVCGNSGYGVCDTYRVDNISGSDGLSGLKSAHPAGIVYVLFLYLISWSGIVFY